MPPGPPPTGGWRSTSQPAQSEGHERYGWAGSVQDLLKARARARKGSYTMTDARQNYVNLVAGLTRTTRDRAVATAWALLAQAGLTNAAHDAGERVSKLAEEIVHAGAGQSRADGEPHRHRSGQGGDPARLRARRGRAGTARRGRRAASEPDPAQEGHCLAAGQEDRGSPADQEDRGPPADQEVGGPPPTKKSAAHPPAKKSAASPTSEMSAGDT